MYKALILDMDGTILNSRPIIEKLYQEYLREFSIEYSDKDFEYFIGASPPEIAKHYSLTEQQGRRAMELTFETFHKHRKDMKIFDGIEEILNLDIKKGVVTSEVREEFEYILEIVGIKQSIFDFTVCANDLPVQKPDPKPLIHCIDNIGVKLSEALYVGDTQFDMKCAYAAGVDFAVAGWGAINLAQFDIKKYLLAAPGDIIKIL